jgi:dihydroorotate dehydrogenase
MMAKYDFLIQPPLLNAAGSLGFTPNPHGTIDLEGLGGFITNPLSFKPRSPARDRVCLAYPGGFLLHTGFPNPGFRKALRLYRHRWERSVTPVIVHLLSETQEELTEMTQRLEGIEGVAGIELGLAPETPTQFAAELIKACSGELPLIVCLPLDRAAELSTAIVGSEVAAVSLGPPRGVFPGQDGKLYKGRLYGPAIFPQALAAVRRLHAMGLTVIGAGGVYTRKSAEIMLEAGASSVQFDSVLWRGLPV